MKTLRILTVAVHGRSPIDQAALAALVATLPGLAVVPVTAVPPPRVLLCPAGKDVPFHAPETAVLLLVDVADPPTIPPKVDDLFADNETPPLSAWVSVSWHVASSILAQHWLWL